ncbi:hypothetical protein StoSoilB22_19990 [Arthrobacter sp. StoSoilB22]|nr:hypothetical protein StoSoilB22_19990 [Arthrobacter sp. StoSoilB22]
MANPVELYTYPRPLTGQVGMPAAAGPKENSGRLGRLMDNLRDHPAQLTGRKDRVEERQDILRRKRGGQNRGYAGQWSEADDELLLATTENKNPTTSAGRGLCGPCRFSRTESIIITGFCANRHLETQRLPEVEPTSSHGHRVIKGMQTASLTSCAQRLHETNAPPADSAY